MSSGEEPAGASAATLQGQELKALLKDSLREILSEDPSLLSSCRAGPSAEEEPPPGESGPVRVRLNTTMMAVDNARLMYANREAYRGRFSSAPRGGGVRRGGAPPDFRRRVRSVGPSLRPASLALQ